MKNKSEQNYYSYVTDRIQALRAKLSRHSTNAVEKEILESKIKYLRKLVDLPVLIAINNMSEDELQMVEKKYGTRDRDFIVHLYGLDELDSFVQKKKIIPLQYMKEEMVEDPETMAKLVQLHEANWDYQNRRQKLQGIGLNGDVSCQQLHQDAKNLDAYSSRVDKAIKDGRENFNANTLKELVSYHNKRSKSLPASFIAKHRSKIEKDPKMKRLADRLAGKGVLGKLDKFLPGRKEREKEFLDAVIDSYNKSKTLTTLCIKKKDIRDMSDKYIESLSRVIEKQGTKLRSEITNKRLEIQASRTSVLEQLKGCEAIQSNLKNQFMSLLSTKTKFLPKMFQEQIWAEPKLIDSLKIAACIKEERDIIEQLNKMQDGPVVPLKVASENEEIHEADEMPKTHVKKAA